MVLMSALEKVGFALAGGGFKGAYVAKNDLMSMMRTEVVFGEQQWLQDLAGTDVAAAVHRVVERYGRPEFGETDAAAVGCGGGRLGSLWVRVRRWGSPPLPARNSGAAPGSCTPARCRRTFRRT